MLVNICVLSFLACTAYILFYIVGVLVDFFQISPQNDDKYSRVFFRLFFGSIALVSLYASIVSKGRTVLILSFLVFVFLRIVNPAKNDSSKKYLKTSLKEGVLLVIPFLLFLVLVFLQLLYTASDHLEPDILFYAKIAEFISLTGENKFHGFYDSNNDFRGMVPYHYFEMWFVNLFNAISNYTSIILLKYFAYPFFKAIAAFGMISLVLSKASFYRTLLVSILIVFGLFIPIEPLLNITNAGWFGYGNIWLRPNLIFYILFTIPAFYYVLKRQYRYALVVSLFVPIVSITTAPSFFLVYGFFSIWLIWKSRNNNFLSILLIGIINASLIIVFYVAAGSPLRLFEHPSWSVMISEQILILEAIIGTVFYLSLQVLFVSVILGLGIIKFKAQFRPLIAIAALTSLFGIILFQLFPLIDNTYQFPYFGYALLNLILVLTVVHIILNARVFWSLLILVASSIMSFQYIEFNKDYRSLISADSIADFRLLQLGYSSSALASVDTLLFDHASIAFTLDENELRTSFNGKRRHFLTMQLGSELSYKFNKLKFYPVVPSEILYNYPPDDPNYTKPIGFNQHLAYYRKELIEEDFTRNFLTENNVSFMLRTTKNHNEYEPVYMDKTEPIKLRNRLFLVQI
jgi:hypothetical protein